MARTTLVSSSEKISSAKDEGHGVLTLAASLYPACRKRQTSKKRLSSYHERNSVGPYPRRLYVQNKMIQIGELV